MTALPFWVGVHSLQSLEHEPSCVLSLWERDRIVLHAFAVPLGDARQSRAMMAARLRAQGMQWRRVGAVLGVTDERARQLAGLVHAERWQDDARRAETGT